MAEYTKLRTKVVLELPRLVPKNEARKETRVGLNFVIKLLAFALT